MILMLNTTYKQKFPTKAIPNLIEDTLLQTIINAFVDDSDLLDALPQQVFIHILLQHLQQWAQYWEKLAFSTGDKLDFIKCYWYIIQ